MGHSGGRDALRTWSETCTFLGITKLFWKDKLHICVNTTRTHCQGFSQARARTSRISHERKVALFPVRTQTTPNHYRLVAKFFFHLIHTWSAFNSIICGSFISSFNVSQNAEQRILIGLGAARSFLSTSSCDVHCVRFFFPPVWDRVGKTLPFVLTVARCTTNELGVNAAWTNSEFIRMRSIIMSS